MLPSAHFFSGLAIFALFNIFGILPASFASLVLCIACSLIPDFDIALSRLHRNMPTHTPFFWACVTIVATVVTQNAWIIMVPFMLHLFLDTFDYGIMVLYPFSSRKYGLAMLNKEPTEKSKDLSSYVREYLSNRTTLYGELAVLLISLLLLGLKILNQSCF